MDDSMNKVFLLGNLTTDPELKTTNGGAPVCMFRIETSRSYRSGDAERTEVALIDVTVFGKNAETVARYMTKGSRLLVEGRLKIDQWQTKDDPPQDRSKLIVIGEIIKFAGASPAHAQRQGDGRW